MSLITEALKKAQRVRDDDMPPAEESAPPTGVTRIVRRGRAHSANTMLLLASGGVVLVVLSVIVTVFLVNRASEAVAPAVAVAAPKPADPAIVPPKANNTPTPVAVTHPTLTVPTPSEPVSAPAPVAIATSNPPSVAVAPVSAAPPPKPDKRIAIFLESIKVAGVRSSGNDSRVLMNERIYRVNDLVDRTLGLKLTGVTADTLTFSDSAGVTYVKQF